MPMTLNFSLVGACEPGLGTSFTVSHSTFNFRPSPSSVPHLQGSRFMDYGPPIGDFILHFHPFRNTSKAAQRKVDLGKEVQVTKRNQIILSVAILGLGLALASRGGAPPTNEVSELKVTIREWDVPTK